VEYFKNQHPNENKSITHHEMEFGILKNTDYFSGSIICFRKIRNNLISKYGLIYGKKRFNRKTNNCIKLKRINYFSNTYFNNSKKLDNRLTKLKGDIKRFYKDKNLSSNIIDYQLSWDFGKGKWDENDLKNWGEKLINAIKDSPEYKRLISETGQLKWIIEEQNSFNQFVENHTRSYDLGFGSESGNTVYVKRDGIDDKLREFINNEKAQTRTIFITGESGLGKSAILANAFKEYSDKNRNDDTIILGHAAHLTPKSAKLTVALQKWIWQLLELDKAPEIEGIDDRLVENITEEKLPYKSDFETYGVLRSNFNKLLEHYSKNKNIVILIDAIDYLENTEIVNHFSWLEKDLPENVKLICTTIKTDRFNPQKFHLEEFYREIKVGNFNTEAKDLIAKLFKLHNKEYIKGNIVNNILNKKTNGKKAVDSPLWINLCLNFLLTLNKKDFEEIEKKTKENPEERPDVQLYVYINETIAELSVDPGELFLQLIERAKKIFKGEFVENVFNYLAISRFGLREIDLRHLMKRDWPTISREEEIKEKEKAPGWDDLQFSYMRRWFSAFFINNGDDERWNISHDILKQSIRKKLDWVKFEDTHRDVIKYLFRLIRWTKHQTSDSFFRTETFYHIWEMDNKSMGINAFIEFDETGLKNSVHFVVDRIENITFRKWFFGLIDFKANSLKRKKEGSRKDDKLYRFCVLVVLEEIFKSLMDYGKYRLTAAILNEIALKIESHKCLFEINEYYNLISILDERYTILKNKLPSGFFNELNIQESVKLSVFQLRFSCTKKILSINEQNSQEEFVKICKNIDDDLKELEQQSEPEIVDELEQFYCEYKGDWLLNRLTKEDSLYFKSNLKVVEQIYLRLKEVSFSLKEQFPYNIEFKARYAKALKRLGNLYHKFLAKTKPKISQEILDYYQKQTQILKEVYEFAPNIVRYKTDFANSLSDLAAYYEFQKMYDEAELYHVKNVELYRNVVDYEEITPAIEENIKIAYQNFVNFYKHQGNLMMVEKYLKKYDEINSILQVKKKKSGENNAGN